MPFCSKAHDFSSPFKFSCSSFPAFSLYYFCYHSTLATDGSFKAPLSETNFPQTGARLTLNSRQPPCKRMHRKPPASLAVPALANIRTTHARMHTRADGYLQIGISEVNELVRWRTDIWPHKIPSDLRKTEEEHFKCCS